MSTPRFRHAIVRKPCKNLVNGITSSQLGKPDYEQAVRQHENYLNALVSCGLEVEVLEADEVFPDSTFIEDVALLTPTCAVITNPGASSRKGEEKTILPAIEKYYTHIEFIREPGTIEAGDIMMTGNHYYIGLSERTNKEGARQMTAILRKHGMDASTVELKEMLHLKTGVAYLENNNLIAAGELFSHPAFRSFDKIKVDEKEAYAANCIWVNGTVIMPAGYPLLKERIVARAYPVIEVDLSEFRKLDGGASCLSLRF